MEQQVFERFRELIYRESGISLSDEKKSLLMNRIGKRLRSLGITSEQKYLEIIELDSSGEELIQLIDAISTNVTYFFREPAHFTFLQNTLTKLAEAGQREIKVWCAASSSGEEPYTICMCANEVIDATKVTFKLLATDICTRVLKHAMQGIYDPRQHKNTPPDYLYKYFTHLRNDGREQLEVRESLRQLVTFRKLNLVKHPIPLKGPIDIIFCRNVMIYFDLPTRTKIIREFERLLPNGGYLVLGHSENLLGIPHNFETVQTAVFRKKS